MKGSKVLKWVILAGIGLRIILWCFQSSPEGDDGARYLRESMNIVDHGVFSTSTGETPTPSAHDMPLWPSIMAVAYSGTGSIKATQYIAGVINILLVTGSVLFLVSMLRHKPFSFDDRQITVAVSVLLFMPDSVMYSLFHMPDQLAVFAVIAALWYYFRGVADDWRYFIGASVAFLISIYAKPICMPLTFALLIAAPIVMHDTWKNKLLVVIIGFCVVVLGLCPWIMRNKAAFGTAGITSISGTNLYSCNWGRLVNTLPEAEREAVNAEMLQFEKQISNYDLMKQSQLKGDYAKRQIFAHLSEYFVYTVKKHPRLYAGTGTVAMLRYLGLERVCDALDAMWGSNNAKGYAPVYDEPYTLAEKAVGGGLQILSWLVLICGYALVVIGIIKGLRNTISEGFKARQLLLVLCPILSLMLLAALIGPITATRYRFIMIPFFAMLAGYSMLGCKDGRVSAPCLRG